MWGWVVHCFKNYAVFRGRASRPEYWWFCFFNLLVGFVVTREAGDLRVPLGFFVWANQLIPSLAVTSRRLHDTGHSFGWGIAQLLTSAPIIALSFVNPRGFKGSPAALALGGVILLTSFVSICLIVLCCRKGDAGPNRYGDVAPVEPGR
jgi:uncharacterized membrane protein YhaH (DUF805 family)